VKGGEGRGCPKGRGRKRGKGGEERGKGRSGGEEVDIVWPDLYLSLRDATVAASGPI